MSLFLADDDDYHDLTSPSPPAELPPAEISVERTRAHYALRNDPDNISVVRSNDPITIPVYETKQIFCTLPLRFYQEIAETMLSHDGLLVLGRGLGCDLITVNLLYALSSPRVSLQQGNVTQQKRSLVILLNARVDEIVKMREAMMELQWINASQSGPTQQSLEDEWEPSLRVVSSADLTNSAKRRQAYENGGALSISLRILVVDMLTGVVSPQDITGIIVTHAERVRETSNESFIVNLYRDGNDWGFVKAVSDEPEAFTGFTPLATKLKILRLLAVFLWPRFHVEVSQLLLRGAKTHYSSVTEIAVRLSPKMAKIQSAILACLQACLLELRRHNQLLETEYWDMENIHDRDFTSRVRLSLESQWHRITWTSKQLVYDLVTLKELLSALLAEDSLLFYQRVQSIVDSNIRSFTTGVMVRTGSPWLMMDEAMTIIAFAKERALGKVSLRNPSSHNRPNHSANDSSNHNSPRDSDNVDVVYNLEELPKWEQLCMVINDIMHERAVQTVKSEGPVLIMCALEKTARQLSAVLACYKNKENLAAGRRPFSCRKYMVQQLRQYLEWKYITTLTRRLTLEFAAEGGSADNAEAEKLNTSKTFTRGRDAPQSKRRRTRGAAAVANVSRLYSGSSYENASAQDLDDAIVQNVENSLKEEMKANSANERNGAEEDEVQFCGMRVGSDIVEHMDRFNQLIIETYDEHTNELLLQEVSPAYIVMYEPDLPFIRRVEIYQAMNPAQPAKVFFMYYGTSVEEQAHLLRIKNEKQLFTKLIKEKAALGKLFGTDQASWKFHLRKSHVVNTRIAGGADFRTENDEMKVVVDLREFNSSLPKLLYRVGMRVVPCMLTVGDYILSPKICVERKAIPDLIASFKSGRLYQQCEQMFRHYALPVLLIEFDESKSFSFEPFAEFRPPGQKATSQVSARLSKQEIQLKIAELLVSFPKLKVLWSNSPYETARIFLELKANQREPDVDEALAKGVNPTIATSDGPPMFNDDAIDVLQTIPGINNLNYMHVIKRAASLAELVCLTREQLCEMLGEENGAKAYHFINHRVQ
ncbi:hypothetical protein METBISCDRAFT_15418 [Metschnikowia bicuspidata]|uniref:ERCC4 domain-containing protein n=1 Tax=Metschnikowia bicuspidata TaxID=27322 RepID=A0A4P9ZFR3_9ASCO|nr:hypothetical protein METBISCDRAFT_15418 [Metschnikowia bicuspidata]